MDTKPKIIDSERPTRPVRVYRDEEGTVVEVVCGPIGGWIIARRGWRNKSRQRINSPNLPTRNARDAAQYDLDGYAVKKGWKEINGGKK